MHESLLLHSRLGVADTVVRTGGKPVVGTGGKPVQVKLRSESVPLELKVTNPGWLLVIMLLIHVWYLDTLA